MATETRETAGLIGSEKVEGTNVYGAEREKIGSIERVMINKKSSQVATDLTKEKLEGAPKYSSRGDWDWEDRRQGRRVYDYYGTAWADY